MLKAQWLALIINFNIIFLRYCVHLEADFLFFSLGMSSWISWDIYFITLICEFRKQLKIIKIKFANGSLRKNEKELLDTIDEHGIILKYGGAINRHFSSICFEQYLLISAVTTFYIFTGLAVMYLILFTFQKLGKSIFLYDYPPFRLKRWCWRLEYSLSHLFLLAFSSLYVLLMRLRQQLAKTIAKTLIQSDLFYFNRKANKYWNNINYVLARSQKPLCLSISPFWTLNFEFFSQTMNSIYSFVMCYRSVYNSRSL